MGIDGKILAFGAFNNPNCPHGGYIYANADSDFRICILSKHLSYDSPWPVRKIPVRCTAHFIAYHLESKTYCVALSETEPSAKICRVAGEEKVLPCKVACCFVCVDTWYLNVFVDVAGIY